jgi:16S rRNA processing protein RimM
MSHEELILIAQVLAAHGIKGEVKLKSFMLNAAEIFSFADIYDDKENKIGKLVKKSITAKSVIASIEGIINRNEAELLKGKKLYIKKSSLKNLRDKEEFYHQDLLKLKVLNEEKKHIASVVGVYNFGAEDILEIAYENGDLEMIAFNKKNVPVINLAAGYLVINPPEII